MADSSFWGHLDDFRKTLWRISIVVFAVMVVAFSFKTTLFDILLAPHKSDFIIYRAFCLLAESTGISSLCPPDFSVELINVQLTSPFLIHISASFYMALLVTFPFIVFMLFRFVSPALRSNEKKYSFYVLFFSCLCFYTGVLLNYFLIFPLSFRFLATYQVSESVVNTITLSSYMSTLTMLSLMMGAVFEIPVVAWFLAKIGILKAAFLTKNRKYAVLILLVLAAFITPTSDIFTLLLVFTPIYLLYELSVIIVKRAGKKPETKPVALVERA
ncbi:MAG: twin-arginine translocase subunit TatC [Bacteroidales bacterium]|nr:twin-arginine translocase subunit TatC [Bacteroidales bacterium]